jgi:hypothetical protein
MSPARDDDHHGPKWGKEMSQLPVSYSSRPRTSIDDNEIVVISESNRESLEEIGKVNELPGHQSRGSVSESSSSKGKEHDVELGLGSEEETSNVSRSSEADDDFDVLRLFGSNPKAWWFGKEPLTRREVNLLTPRAEHQDVYRQARCDQVVWGVLGTLEALFVPTCIGLAYYVFGLDAAAVWGPAMLGILAAVALVSAIYSLYYFFRASGIVRHTEANVS